MYHSTSRKAMGARLKRFRTGLNKTQQTMAFELGMPLKYYGDVERGTIGISKGFLLRLTGKYDISADYILTGHIHPDATCPLIDIYLKVPDHRKEVFIDIMLRIMKLSNDSK